MTLEQTYTGMGMYGAYKMCLAKYADDRMHITQMKSFFASLWESALFADFEIHVEGQVIVCHKVVICASSDVFLAMFQTNCAENTQNKMYITDFSHKVVRLMLEYIYVGDLTKEFEEYADDLLRIADKYNVNDLKSKVSRIIESKITIDKVLSILVLADTCNVPKMKEKAVAFIRLNYKPVRSSEEFTSFYKQHPHLLVSILDAEIGH